MAQTTTERLAERLRRPACGLVMLRSSPRANAQPGVSALLEISADGDVTLWGGANFDSQLVSAPLSELSFFFSEDPAHGNMFLISAAANSVQATAPDAVPAAAVYCFVRNTNTWLAVLRRHGVTTRPLVLND